MGAEAVESHRARLVAHAYRMLGSRAQAEDVVQEAYARWFSAPRDAVQTPVAFLTTMVTHLCLDHLKSAQAQRETYVGSWLPEPVAALDADAQSISYAFMTLLETLSPLERAVYLLREVFEYNPAEVAAMLGRSEAAVRQSHHRAREAVLARRPRFAPDRQAHLRLVTGFLDAARSGDFDALQSLIASEAVMRSDGGGKAAAVSREVVGASAIAKLYVGFLRAAPEDLRMEVRDVNGWPALVAWTGPALRVVVNFETDGEHILGVYAMVNPDKLAGLASLWRPPP